MNSNKSYKTGASLVEITAAQIDQRLDNFLLGQLGNIPRTRVYRIIRKGEVRVNRKRSKPDYRLQPGDQVRIPPLWIEPESAPLIRLPARLAGQLEQAVIYENEHLLVLDKPAGLAVHSGSGVAYGCIDVVRQMRAADDIELAHRLDRDTSGCLMLCKHRRALLAIQGAIRDGSLGKNYLALVSGSWPRSQVEISHSLKKYHLSNGERRVRVDAAGKSALSRVELLQGGKEFSLLRIELVSGRTHQIRVHCQAEGHPLGGDDKYGDPAFNRLLRERGIKRLMLHATSLELPLTDYTPEIVINAPLPKEFESFYRGDAAASVEK